MRRNHVDEVGEFDETLAREPQRMVSAKQLLLDQTADAFGGRPDMSLMASLDGITQREAAWSPDESTPSIEQIVRHVAWAKSRYCEQAFGNAMVLIDEGVDDHGDSPGLPWEFPCGAGWGCRLAPGIDNAVGLLAQAHRVVEACLASCSDESLGRPLPTRHGKSAAHLFWVLLMHDLYHAGQIRTRRTLCGASDRPHGGSDRSSVRG